MKQSKHRRTFADVSKLYKLMRRTWCAHGRLCHAEPKLKIDLCSCWRSKRWRTQQNNHQAALLATRFLHYETNIDPDTWVGVAICGTDPYFRDGTETPHPMNFTALVARTSCHQCQSAIAAVFAAVEED